MMEGNQRAAWGHTSNIMALIANANRDSKTRPSPFRADDFNPYAVKSHIEKSKDNAKIGIHSLKVFLDRKNIPKGSK